MTVRAGIMAGQPRFFMLSPCGQCVLKKVACNRELACCNCVGSAQCTPSAYEFISRAKYVMKLLMGGELIHNDVCKYQIHMQSSVNSMKPILSRIDARDIYKRIEIIQPMHPMMEFKSFKFELCAPMVELVQGNPVHKLEYMKDGYYVCQPSIDYEQHIIHKDEINRISKTGNVSVKLVDTINLNDIGVAYKLWVESVNYPMIQVQYAGPGYWRGDGVVCYTTVKMMSAILTCTRIVTVTTVSRGQVYKMG